MSNILTWFDTLCPKILREKMAKKFHNHIHPLGYIDLHVNGSFKVGVWEKICVKILTQSTI